MGTVAEKLTYLNGTKSSLKTAINNLGGDITNATTFRNYANVLNDIYDNLPKVSDTGTNVSLNPTLKGRLGIVPKGNTYQDSTTGKNLVNIFDANAFKYGNGQDKTTVDLIGIIKTTSNYSSSRNKGILIENLKQNTDYTVSFIVDSILTESQSKQYELEVRAYNSDDSFNTAIVRQAYTTIGSIIQKTFNSATYDKIAIHISGFYDAGSDGTLTYHNLMVEEGTTATSYEPYTGGQPAPSPDFPMDIQSATGTQKVVVSDNDDNSQEVDIELNDIELNQIGDYEDYISGTPDNWILYKNIGKVVFNGSEDWIIYNSNTSRVVFRTDINDIEKYTNDNDTPKLLCNRFIPISYNGTWHVGNVSRITSVSKRILLVYEPNTTANDFKSWLSSHNTEVLYVLAETQQTPITEEPLVSQLNELYYLQSYNDTTNIDVTGNLPMRITASALKGA